MYRLGSRMLIIVSCVMAMVRVLPVNTEMVIWILTGVIICEGIDAGIVENIAKRTSIIKKSTLEDIFTAFYIFMGIFVPAVFFMLPCAIMPVWKKKYKMSKAACIMVAVKSVVQVFYRFRNQNIYSGDYGVYEIIETAVLSAVAVMLFYGGEMIITNETQMHKMRDESAEHNILMSRINKQLIETQNAKIYSATLKERNRIAREIHDNVGHMITRSILQVGAIGVINKDENLKLPISELKGTLDSAMGSMRKSVHDLHDESVDLKAALKQLEPSTDDFTYELEYDCGTDVPGNIKYAFISIAAEAVNNAVKYSCGDRINVIVREHPAFYQLQIMDNGTGADKERMSDEAHGIGIKNIKDRVASLGGTLKIDTVNGFMIFATVMK